jgi:hypothetical protein
VSFFFQDRAGKSSRVWVKSGFTIGEKRGKRGGSELRKLGFIVMLAVVAVLAATAISLSGCGKEETTLKTPEGEVKVGEKGGEVTVTTEEGESTYRVSEKPPSEEELGVPVHPKAKFDPEAGGGTASFRGSEGEGSYMVASYVVDAGFDEVVSWYKGKLGEPMAVMMTDTKQAMWSRQEGGSYITVVVSEEEGKVTLVIGKAASQ